MSTSDGPGAGGSHLSNTGFAPNTKGTLSKSFMTNQKGNPNKGGIDRAPSFTNSLQESFRTAPGALKTNPLAIIGGAAHQFFGGKELAPEDRNNARGDGGIFVPPPRNRIATSAPANEAAIASTTSEQVKKKKPTGPTPSGTTGATLLGSAGGRAKKTLLGQ